LDEVRRETIQTFEWFVRHTWSCQDHRPSRGIMLSCGKQYDLS
jgi:hypothetical protein